MRALTDTIKRLDEPKKARLEVRTQQHVKDTIHQAAVLSGVDDSAFIVSTAYEAAKATIKAHELTVLDSDADKAAFFVALDDPPAPTDRLKRAFAMHGKTVTDAG